ncbi:hypothetical protein [Bacteroides pyogenes]|uniref:hypothetical protein n=1 Tax=Bacteroides pyogenes TaxID=310300 RepID=UPI001F284E3C|nr:hypothetical protein [Bacteroides pyogenes]MCE9108267.1 hypothetical protein [Bacteroides pyogenes]
MKIKNFATFGLFVDGDMIDSGSIHAMENEATRRILSGQAEAARISVFDFDGDKVVEKTPVLSLRRNNNDIIIANMLLPDNSESVRKNRTLIEIKDIVDEIMECDSLVDRTEFDTVRCNIGSRILWTCDLVKLEQYFDIKGVIAEGDNIALLIRNF